MISLVLSLAGAAATGPLQGLARDSLEPVVVEMALGRLAARTVAAWRNGSVALLPVGELLELAELRVEPEGDGLRALREPRGLVLTIDPGSRRLAVDGRSWTVPAEAMLHRDGEIYLASDEAGRWLDLRWVVSWSDLTVTALDPSALPIGARIGREWKRRLELARGRADDRSVPLLRDRRSVLDGLVLDYGVFAPAGASLGRASYSAGAGAELLGGSLTASYQTRAGGAQGRADASWSKVWLERPWLAHVRLGDGVATGPRPRTVRGVSFGNAPYLRPNEIGEVAFTGSLGPGWQVEAWRGGRLISYDSADALGRYSIDAPIAYGENPVEFVAYGPFGEVRRFNRMHRVSADRIQAGRIEYGVSAGACRTERCRATANADLRYGLSTRWTARAGLDQFWRADSLGALFHPYAGLFGVIGNGVGVDAEVVANAVVRGTIRYEASADFIVEAEATRFARGVTDPLLTPAGRTSQFTLSGLYRPDARLSGWYLEGSLDHAREEGIATTGARLGGALQLRQLQLYPGIRWRTTRGTGRAATDGAIDLTATLLPLPRLGPVFGQLTARGYLEVDPARGLSAFNARVARNLDRAVRVEVGGGWSRFAGPTLSLNVAANFAAVRGFLTVDRAAGRTSATQYLQGSVLYDPVSRGFRLAAGPALERAGVTGRVFLDDNGNDRFDEGEQLLPDVRVAVGLETRTSDRHGAYNFWNVTPYQPAVIAVDSATLASPLWVPARPVAVEAGPNRYRIVDLPVAPGGVIDGRVQRADGRGVAGVGLVLRNLDTGAERTITSFSDGEFYAMGIRSGRYQLALAPRSATRLGATADPVPFTMEATADGGAVSALRVILR